MRPAEIMAACFQRLNVSGVTSLLSSAYAPEVPIWPFEAPQAADSESPSRFPYITIEPVSDVDFSTSDNLGGNAVVQVNIWYRGNSPAAVGAIMRAALLATVRKDWNVPGFITCEREMWGIREEDDGKTLHGILRLRVLYLDHPPGPNPWSSEFSEEFG